MPQLERSARDDLENVLDGFHDGLGGQSMPPLHEFLTANLRRESCRDADSPEWDSGYVGFRKRFCHGAAQTTQDAMFLKSENRARFARRCQNCSCIQRLQSMHAQQSRLDSLSSQALGCAHGRLQNTTGPAP